MVYVLRMQKKRSLAEIHVAVVLFGIAGLFGKWIVLAPTIIVLGRVFFASITLALILLISKQTLLFPKKSTYFLLVSLGFLLAVHWTVFFQSIQISTVAVGLLSYSSFPVFTAFLEPLFFKEKIQFRNIIYACMCILGIFLIIPKYDLNDTILQGVLWGLAAGLTFSVLTIFNRKLSQRYSSLVIAFYQDFFATLFLLPFFFILRPALDLKNIILLCILGIFCTAGSHTLFIKGMKYIRAQTAAIISSLEPVYGIVIAFFFLHEIPSLRTVLGGIIILWAAFSVTWSGIRQTQFERRQK
jgi:drug/metabolite transporter (DMT)-like permease